MEEISFHIDELIAAILFIITGGGLGTVIAKNKGWITFGKPTERRNCSEKMPAICAEHTQMVLDLSHMTTEILHIKDGQSVFAGHMTAIKVSQAEIYTLLRTLNGKVERLVGYQEGKNGVRIVTKDDP